MSSSSTIDLEITFVAEPLSTNARLGLPSIVTGNSGC